MLAGKTTFRNALIAAAFVILALETAHFIGIAISPLLIAATVLCALSFFLVLRRDDNRGRYGVAKLEHEAEALNSHAMVTLSDPKAGIFHVNDKLLQATGFLRSEIIGKPTSVFYFDEDVAMFEEIRAGLSAGRPWSGELRLRCKDDSFIWTLATILPRLDAKGNLVGSISIRTDITATKAAAEQKELYSMLDGLRDEIYLVDVNTLAFTYMNRAALARTGWNAGEVRGKFVWDEYPEMNVDVFRERLATLVSGEKDQLCATRRIDDIPFEVRVHLLRGADGGSRAVVVMRDSSEQERNERAKSELLSTISHELRTPMTSIKGAMGLLLSNAAGDMTDKARSMLSIAHRNADRLVNIVNDILDVEKIAAGQMEFNIKRAPLVNVLEEAVVANEPFASRFDVSVDRKGFDTALLADYDFDRTLQVMTNLLSNAAKFSPPGGKIEVSLEQSGDQLRINVRDFGKGIPAEVQPRLFQRFVQAPGQPRSVNGTGLGLYICKLIMTQQGGAIGFESTEGEGAVFHIELPRASGDAESDPVATARSN
ncbi:MAG: PAS domain-containing protein [Pseudooceanicola sp.]|nr:PAS domain-containing protein [Pseudooceanicola sp.]